MDFYVQKKTGGFNLLNQIAHTGVRVKVLIPSGSNKQDKVNSIKPNYQHIEFRSLQFSLQMVIGITIIDREKTMIFEIKDDTKDNFLQTLGLAIYIEGKSAALSYVSIFENLWKQTELLEQLQTHDRMQREFINTAAHELRTPIQPILGITELVKKEIKDDRHKELLEVISRNAHRLKNLSEDILEASKIENNSLNLNKEYFKIKDLILEIINSYENNTGSKNIRFEYALDNDNLTIHADRNGLSHVISNLINNSVKFTHKEGRTISVFVKSREINNGNKEDKEVVGV